MAVTKEILTLAVETGDALLRNGAEVYRVEDTVLHILKAYEITDCDVYVLSNGIFASANENKEDACSMIRHGAFSIFLWSWQCRFLLSVRRNCLRFFCCIFYRTRVTDFPDRFRQASGIQIYH